MTDSKMIDRIRALFSKANDPSVTEAEAVAFLFKAEELLEKYNVDRSLLDEKEEVQESIDRTYLKTSYGHTRWRASLVSMVAQMFFCKGFGMSTAEFKYINGKEVERSKITKWMFVGKDTNRAIAVSMFLYLEATVVRLSKNYSKDGNDRYHFETSCGLRLASRIRMKIDERDRGVNVSSNLPAIVRNELTLIDNFMKDEDITQSRERKGATLNAASIAGFRAANNISLETQIGTANMERKIIR